MRVESKCPHCGKVHKEFRDHSGSSIIKCEGCGEKYIAVARMQLEVESLKVVDEVILDRKLGIYVSKRTGKAVKP